MRKRRFFRGFPPVFVNPAKDSVGFAARSAAVDVLYDCALLPNIIDTQALKGVGGARMPYGLIDRAQFRRKGHHDRHEIELNVTVWHLKRVLVRR